MTDIAHPPIAIDVLRSSMADDFVQSAYEILNTYQMDYAYEDGGYEITVPITDRVDMVSEAEGTEFAMRLVRRVVHEMTFVGETRPEIDAEKPQTWTEETDEEDRTAYAEDFVAIELQYGTITTEDYEDTDEPLADEDFVWHPYLFAIANTITKETFVLDGQTGKEFQDADLMVARPLLETLRSELRESVFRAAIRHDGDIPIARTDLTKHYEPLEVGEQLDLNYSCPECGIGNAPCGCNVAKLN